MSDTREITMTEPLSMPLSAHATAEREHRQAPSVVTTVLRREAQTVLRNRGVLLFFAGILVISESVLRLTGTAPRALVTLLNLILLGVPLVTIMFGVISWHASREFNELLLAQPVRRDSLYAGLYLGLVLPLAAAFALGLSIPFFIHRALTPESLQLFATVVGSGIALTFVFGGLALLLGVLIEDRLRSVAAALAVWLVLTVAYDGLVLLVATTFSDYALERPMLVLTVFNPVDLARTLIVLQSDSAALMGYTGAVMNRFLGSAAGVMVAAFGMMAWIVIPAWAGRRAFRKRDF